MCTMTKKKMLIIHLLSKKNGKGKGNNFKQKKKKALSPGNTHET